VAPKHSLLRLAAVRQAPHGDDAGAVARVVPDPAARLPGRGAYVCNAACAETALRRRALPRAFRRAVTTAPDFVESIG
jgi:predicted RNA-binding protein YlxR (DUF448 family)